MENLTEKEKDVIEKMFEVNFLEKDLSNIILSLADKNKSNPDQYLETMKNLPRFIA